MRSLLLISAIAASAVTASRASAQQQPADILLETLINRSEFVVVGKVVNLGQAPLDPETGKELFKWGPLATEHDPQWHVAIIEVSEILLKPKAPPCGTAKVIGKRVYVLYAGSEDVMWFQSPKLKVGQEAIFILDDFPGPKGLSPNLSGTGIYLVIIPLQVQPKNQLERVKKFLF